MPGTVLRRGLTVLVFVSLVLRLAIHLPAQDTTADPFAALLAPAQAAYAEHRWDAAAAAFQAVLDAARREHADLWEGRALYGLGSVDTQKARYGDARDRLTAALAIFDRLGATREIGWTTNMLGNVAGDMFDHRVAAAWYARAADAFRTIGDERSRVASTFGILRELDVADPDIDERFAALERDVQALGDPGLEGRVLHAWADRYFTRGDYEPALEKLEQATVVLEHADDADELGTVDNSLGRLFRLHGQLNAALQYQLKALAIHEAQGGVRSRIQSLNAVAVTYQSLSDSANAKKYFERALALAADTGDGAILSFLRANYGDFLADIGEAARGRDLLTAALEDAEPAYRTARFDELSGANLRLGRNADALAASERAIEACGSAPPVDCIRARVTRGRAELALGDETAALGDQQTALQSVEDLRAKLAASDFLRQDFGALWAPVYSLAIDLQSRRGETRAALDTAERGRSRALLDLLASRQLQPSDPRPASAPLLTLRGDPGSAAPSRAMAESATADDLAAITARLHSTMLLYWVADDRIYEWALSPNGALHGVTVPIDRAQLAGWIHATSAFLGDAGGRPAATTRGGQTMALVMRPQPAWSALYTVLIAPLAAYLPAAAGARLTIVPHGPLLNVPFAALRDPEGHYLIERYAIHSVPAGALLAFTAGSRHPDARAGSMLLVADPARPPSMAGEPPLPRLPGANAEVRAIAALLPARRTTVLADVNATSVRVLAALAHQAVIHFATHAIVRDADPLSSFLALSRSASDATGGRLSAAAIYGLHLDADLVVLSACRSGGALTNGDGVAALARAFFYAGTPSLVVSLWDVADQPTNRLLPAFYREWLRGTDKARALRAAQVQLIADLRAGRVTIATPAGTLVLSEDPAFWAGFVLLGEPD